MPTLRISDFSGGLNLRDSPNELAPNESAVGYNWTLNQRRAIKARQGLTKVATLPGTTGKNSFIFYSAALNQWLCARESAAALHLFSRPGDLSGGWTDRGAINSVVTAKAAFVDFPGTTPKVVIATDVISGATKGIWTWDGTTLVNVSTTVAGSAIALWQNKVWVLGYPTSDANGTPPDLFACAAGDPTIWATGAGGLRVGLRDKDAAPGIALGIAGGALIAFKQRSVYRITDPATGANSTLDAAAGCFGSESLAGFRGRLYTWGLDGIYEWDGIGRGRSVGDKLRPLFVSMRPGSTGKLAAGVSGDSVVFFHPALGTVDAGGVFTIVTVPGWVELNPPVGWLVHHFDAIGGTIQAAAQKEDVLYAAGNTDDGLYTVFTATPGADDGTLYDATGPFFYRTGWLEPAQGKLCRILRAQVEGLLANAATNTLKLRVYKDGDLSTYDEYDVTSDLRASSATDAVQATSIRSLGHARSFAFEFVAGTAIGDTAVFSLTLDWIPLER